MTEPRRIEIEDVARIFDVPVEDLEAFRAVEDAARAEKQEFIRKMELWHAFIQQKLDDYFRELVQKETE